MKQIFLTALSFLIITSYHGTRACSSKKGISTPITPMDLKDLPRLKYPGSLSAQKANLIISQIQMLEAAADKPVGLSWVQNVLTIPNPVSAISVYTINALMDFVASTTELERQLTTLRIDSALVQGAIVDFKANLYAVQEQINYLKDSSLTPAQKYVHAHLALDNCKKISHRFQNPDFILSKAPLATLSYLKNFALIFAAVGHAVVKMQPKDYTSIAKEFRGLRSVLRDYGNFAWAERVSLILSITDKSCYYLFHVDDMFKRRPLTLQKTSSRCSWPDEEKSQAFPVRGVPLILGVRAVLDKVTGQVLCESFDGCYDDYLKKLKEEHLLLLKDTLKALQISPLSGQQGRGGANALKENCGVNWVKTPVSFSVRQVWDGSLPPLDRASLASIEPIKGGNEVDNYLCRVLKNEDWIPGWSDGIKCWVAMGEGEVFETMLSYRNTEAFTILASIWQSTNAGTVVWRPAPTGSDITVPVNAVIGGHISTGSGQIPVAIGRCNIAGVGKVSGYIKEGVTYIASRGRAYTCRGSESEILLCE